MVFGGDDDGQDWSGAPVAGAMYGVSAKRSWSQCRIVL